MDFRGLLFLWVRHCDHIYLHYPQTARLLSFPFQHTPQDRFSPLKNVPSCYRESFHMTEQKLHNPPANGLRLLLDQINRSSLGCFLHSRNLFQCKLQVIWIHPLSCIQFQVSQDKTADERKLLWSIRLTLIKKCYQISQVSEEKNKVESGKGVKTSAKFIILSPINFLRFSATNKFFVWVIGKDRSSQ